MTRAMTAVPWGPRPPGPPTVPRRNHSGNGTPVDPGQPFRPGTLSASIWAMVAAGVPQKRVAELMGVSFSHVRTIKQRATNPRSREYARRYMRGYSERRRALLQAASEAIVARHTFH